jgi:hypothetical protein
MFKFWDVLPYLIPKTDLINYQPPVWIDNPNACELLHLIEGSASCFTEVFTSPPYAGHTQA